RLAPGRYTRRMDQALVSETAHAAPSLAPFEAPAWLRNAHLQTLYASCIARCPRVSFARKRWSTPDGDFVDLDWLTPRRGTMLADSHAPAPLIVVFHGLEGSSSSHYAHTLMHAIDGFGWRGVVAHFRGCSGEPNLLARAYHSGDSADVDWILRR